MPLPADYSRFDRCGDCGQLFGECSCLPMETIGRSAGYRVLTEEERDYERYLRSLPEVSVRIPFLAWRDIRLSCTPCPDCGHVGLPCPGPHGAD